MRSEGFTHVLRFNLGTSRGDRLNLLFGTCAELGVEKFKDAMWDADPIQGAGFQDPRDPWQQMLSMKHEPALAPLERLLHRELLQAPRRTMSVGQLRDFTKLKTLFKAAHVTPALKNLDHDGLIERATGSFKIRTTEVTASPEQLDLFGQTATFTLVSPSIAVAVSQAVTVTNVVSSSPSGRLMLSS